MCVCVCERERERERVTLPYNFCLFLFLSLSLSHAFHWVCMKYLEGNGMWIVIYGELSRLNCDL